MAPRDGSHPPAWSSHRTRFHKYSRAGRGVRVGPAALQANQLFPNVRAPGCSAEGSVPGGVGPEHPQVRGGGHSTVRAGIIAALCALAFLAYSGWAVTETAPQVEADVRHRVHRTLMAEKLGFADATVLGRDVYLTGSLANDVYYRSASAAVARIPGVRRIGRTETPGIPSLVRVTVTPERVILRGDVAEPEVRAAVVVATGDVLGRRVLVDSLKIDLGRGPPLWPEEFGAVLRSVAEVLDEFDLYLAGTGLYVEGVVDSELVRTELGEVLAGHLPGFVINNAVRVPVEREEFERRLRMFLDLRPLDFDGTLDELNGRLRRNLDELVPLLRSFPNARIRVESHVGPTGDEARDLTLTHNRANAVRDYLIARGVPPTTVEAVGLGGSTPVADNASPGGRLANDRIELHVIEEG